MKAICDFTKMPAFTLQEGTFNVIPCFLPVMGKPWIQHCIESIERLGVREVAVYLSQYADELEQMIGDGERWGLSVSYHLVKRNVSVPKRAASSAFLKDDEPVLYCTLNTLPALKPEHLKQSGRFTGSRDTRWRWCTRKELADFASLPETPVEALFLEQPQDYLDTLKSVLSSGGGNLVFLGKLLRTGIWAGPGCSISPSAALVPPVYIGSQVRIGDGAIVGPNAEIGQRSIIDSQSVIIDSSLLPGSYVGKSLDIKQCIIHRSQVLHVPISAVYTSTDGLLLSSVESSRAPGSSPAALPARILAAVLAAVSLPVQAVLLLLNLLVNKRGLIRYEAVVIPQQYIPGSLDELITRRESVLKCTDEITGSIWNHLLWQVLPGLWSVAAGRKRFFGLPARTPEEFHQLTADWRGIYLRSKPGLISEADVIYDGLQETEMLFASEMFQSANDSFRFNASLLKRYLKALFRGRT